jgi:hypothetical protein
LGGFLEAAHVFYALARAPHFALAVPQLLYPETTALKWHFPQENVTLHDAGKGT